MRKPNEIAELAHIQRSTVYAIIKRLEIEKNPVGYDDATVIQIMAEAAKRRSKPQGDDPRIKVLEDKLTASNKRGDELQANVTWLQAELVKIGDRLDREQALHLMADRRSDKLMARGLLQRIANTPVEVLDVPKQDPEPKTTE